MRSLSMALGVLAACGGDPASAPAGGAGGSGGDGATASTATTSTGAMPAGATLTGLVRDAQGAPLPDAFLGLCADACWASASGPDGRFSYDNVPAGAYHLDVRVNGTPGNPDVPPTTGTISIAMTLDVDETLALPPVFVPDPGAATIVASGSQAVSLAGLSLTVDPAEWSLPFGVDTPYVAAVRVPEPQWPPNAVDAGEVLARWALNPYGTRSDGAMPISFDNDFALAAGSTVQVHTLNPNTGMLEVETTATVSADGTRIDAAGGITRITWIVLSAP